MHLLALIFWGPSNFTSPPSVQSTTLEDRDLRLYHILRNATLVVN